MERLALRLEAAVLQDWAAEGCILRRRNEGKSRGRPQQEAEPSGAENNGAPLFYCLGLTQLKSLAVGQFASSAGEAPICPPTWESKSF